MEPGDATEAAAIGSDTAQPRNLWVRRHPCHPREAAALGAAAARERSSRGITQQQVAGAMDVSVDEVAALEAGTGPVGQRETEQVIASYARALAQIQKSGPD